MSESSAVGTRSRQPKEMTRAAILERAYDMYLQKELVHGDLTERVLRQRIHARRNPTERTID